MSTYFNGADSNTYSSYYGPGGSVTIGAGVEIGGSNFSVGISMAGEGTILNLGLIVSSRIYYIDTGIYLKSGGMITNGSVADTTAEVEANAVGISLGSDGTVINFGLVRGSDAGIDCSSPAEIVNGGFNDYSASIESEIKPIELQGGGEVLNFGSIISYEKIPGDDYGESAIYNKKMELYLKNGNNYDRSAKIASDEGVSSLVGTIQNYGEIIGSALGIGLLEGGLIDNSGTIVGGAGIQSVGDITIYNSGTIAGTIAGSKDSVGLGRAIAFGYSDYYGSASEFIDNGVNGLISSQTSAIYGQFVTTGTVINYGTIEIADTYTYQDGRQFAIRFENPNDVLVVEGGSKIVGGVWGGGSGGRANPCSWATSIS